METLAVMIKDAIIKHQKTLYDYEDTGTITIEDVPQLKLIYQVLSDINNDMTFNYHVYYDENFPNKIKYEEFLSKSEESSSAHELITDLHRLIESIDILNENSKLVCVLKTTDGYMMETIDGSMYELSLEVPALK